MCHAACTSPQAASSDATPQHLPAAPRSGKLTLQSAWPGTTPADDMLRTQSGLQYSPLTRCRRRANYAISLAKRGSVPIRDETGRFIGVRPKTAAERAMKQPLGSGGIFKSAAVEVLRQEKRLMSTGEPWQGVPVARWVRA